jgi:septal ring factor EnvC (AmiA/AmiB activator)
MTRNRLRFLFFLCGGFLLCRGISFGDATDALLHRYEKQIRLQERQMSGLRLRLAEKEKDIVLWQSKSEAAKSAWTDASAMIEETRAKIAWAHDKRQKTQIQADAALWKTTENVLLSRSAVIQAGVLAQDLYETDVALKSRSALSVEEAAPEFIFSEMAQLSASSQVMAEQAQKEEAVLRNDEMRWQGEEMARLQEAERLHQKQESQWLKWQDALRRKTALEDEISQIDLSAKALQVMLQELRDHRDQAKALRENRSANDEVLASLRGTLPWPAQGKVVQTYGRQYSEGLNQLVISNGIKIQPGINHVVRVIQAGKVLFANSFHDYGQLVIVQHASGLTSVYAGLGQTQVKEGQTLAALDSVGLTGDNGSFYFELRRDEQPINPLAYLVPVPSSELSLRRTFR